MKSYIKNFTAIVAVLFLVSCSNDDNNTSVTNNTDDDHNSHETTGNAELFFDNSVNGDDLMLNTIQYTNSNGETLTISRFNYIISNVVLINSSGEEVVYPKEKSYFIINESTGETSIQLQNIPAGDYKAVRFGIGVDNQRYLQGETAQQSFWDLAAQNDMTWTWSTGYRFINFEGTFTSAVTGSEPKVFQVHQGSNTATDNYREVTLTLPNTARVRHNEQPSIHIVADANKILDGQVKIKLSDAMNTAGTAAAIMGGEKLIAIAGNTQQMFTVDHVHNGAGSHHE